MYVRAIRILADIKPTRWRVVIESHALTETLCYDRGGQPDNDVRQRVELRTRVAA